MFRLFVALLLGATMPALAQQANPVAIAEEQAAIAKLAWMKGIWRGPAVTQTANGPHKVTQTERIGGFLDGTLLLMEGKGFNADSSAGFHAFGVLSYDPNSKGYTLTSHAQGYGGAFKFTPTGTGYVWEVPAGPNAVLRYTATLHDGTWTEVGDRIVAGQPPQRTFEMNLKRVGDTDWPEAGANRPD
jgi:hypothetical protein